jgi:thiamine-phosphate pyrophosphorylase
VEAVAAAVAGGGDWVQLREKDLDGAPLLSLADAVGEAARRVRAGVRLLVNRRVDVALAAGWDGVHLGFDALPVAAARALLPPGATVGVACHAPDEVAARAREERPDYAHLAPVFDPRSKPATRFPLGLAALERAARAAVPILAQGGIDAERAQQCVAAGAAGVAVTGEILGASDPARAAAALREALDRAPARSQEGR